MEIISYQIAGAQAANRNAIARGLAPVGAVPWRAESAQVAEAVQRKAERAERDHLLAKAGKRLGLSLAVLAQYRLFLGLTALGAFLGFGIWSFDVYREGFARTVDLASYGRLDRGGLDDAFEQFATEGGTGSAYEDDLALFADTGDAAQPFVFANPVSYTTYTVQRGDTISGLSARFGLKKISTIIAANNISNVREIYTGQKLKVPSLDGLNYTVAGTDTLAALSTRYNIAVEDLLDVNDLATETLEAGQIIFVPGAELDATTLRRAMGELFAIPLRGRYRLTSGYGYRRDPFTGVRDLHTGLDMAAPTGTPVRSAMSGRVVVAGWSAVYGNYIIINHGNGYQTLYGHLSKIQVRNGQGVNQGSQIGLVGNTGRSTGSHLHFTVYRNGKLINPVTVLRL